MLATLISQNIYRKYLLKKAPAGPLRKYLETPLADISRSVPDTEFISLDFETTGLNFKKDSIVSLGYTLIRNSRIVLAESGYLLVNPDRILDADNVIIHQITDDQAQQGLSLEQAMNTLLAILAGRILITHHARIERTFLIAACNELYGFGLPLLVIDTLNLERKKLQRQHQAIKPNSLRLFNLRNEYGLPRYNAHNAFEDSIATAELFLAIVNHKTDNLDKSKIKDFL